MVEADELYVLDLVRDAYLAALSPAEVRRQPAKLVEAVQFVEAFRGD